MKIGIDIRPLLEEERGGVGEYTHELLRAIFHIDKENEYYLFANSLEEKNLPKFLNNPNAKIFYKHIPNKLLNTSIRFLNWPKIDKLISKDEKIDLFFFPNLNFLSLSNNVPYVVTFHDLSFEIYPSFFTFKERLWHKMINPKKVAQKSAKIISVSQNTKNDLIKIYGIEPEKVSVNHLGIKNDFFNDYPDEELKKIKKELNLPEKYILFLSSQEERKNPVTLLEAYAELQKNPEFKNIHLVMVGKEKLKKKIKKTIKKLEITEKVHTVGYVPKHLRCALYKLAELFVYPSYYEGFGLPPLEAMASGTPVISSHTSSLGEILNHSAILIDPYNVNDLYRAMTIVLKDEMLRNKMIENGKDHAKKFSWQVSAQKTIDIFKEVYKNKKP